jgi:hypothetical protein
MEIHIGNIIRRVVFEKKAAVQPLTTALEISEGSMSRIYASPSLHAKVLQKLSIALKYDFFEIYSKELNIPKEEIKKEVVVVVVSDSEKIIAERDLEIAALKKEIGYLTQINELHLLKRK